MCSQSPATAEVCRAAQDRFNTRSYEHALVNFVLALRLWPCVQHAATVPQQQQQSAFHSGAIKTRATLRAHLPQSPL